MPARVTNWPNDSFMAAKKSNFSRKLELIKRIYFRMICRSIGQALYGTLVCHIDLFVEDIIAKNRKKMTANTFEGY